MEKIGIFNRTRFQPTQKFHKTHEQLQKFAAHTLKFGIIEEKILAYTEIL